MVNVLKNPSEKEVARLTRGGAIFRAAKDYVTGDLYLWEAEAASHNEVIERIGNYGNVDSVGQVGSAADYRKLLSK
ncbi:protein of unknown function [Magnetospirillum sp. XM-1]|uniref:hypothetical protein n=1 Tax=Magnetospirillum sp. XM-1 TaxID=1663591 RepID=UPI00073DD97D|nr:hypothetical protein [Magnetospirillum sp. XM-1]CUW37170.1 protein of unknown function [Magnetospirillum sp. XM-1]